MKLREDLELAHEEHLDELNLGFITSGFRALSAKTADYVRSKVLSSWQQVKDALAKSKEAEEKFLDYLNYVFDHNFSSIHDVDMVFARVNEAEDDDSEENKTKWEKVKTFLKTHMVTILGIIAIITEIAMTILKSMNLTLSVVYVIVSIAVLLTSESEAQTTLKELKKKTEEYQRKVGKITAATNKVKKAKKALTSKKD